MVQTRACVFQDAVDLERVQAWDQVFIKLMRRYKYLKYVVSEEMRKILVYLRGFTQVSLWLWWLLYVYERHSDSAIFHPEFCR